MRMIRKFGDRVHIEFAGEDSPGAVAALPDDPGLAEPAGVRGVGSQVRTRIRRRGQAGRTTRTVNSAYLDKFGARGRGAERDMTAPCRPGTLSLTAGILFPLS